MRFRVYLYIYIYIHWELNTHWYTLIHKLHFNTQSMQNSVWNKQTDTYINLYEHEHTHSVRPMGLNNIFHFLFNKYKAMILGQNRVFGVAAS